MLIHGFQKLLRKFDGNFDLLGLNGVVRLRFNMRCIIAKEPQLIGSIQQILRYYDR